MRISAMVWSVSLPIIISMSSPFAFVVSVSLKSLEEKS